MPGNVADPAPSTTLPAALAASYVRADEYAVLSNQYARGEHQARLLGQLPRARWKLSRRLPPEQMAELRAFYQARGGPLEAFYFVDELGVQRVVRFAGGWGETIGPSRDACEFELLEV